VPEAAVEQTVWLPEAAVEPVAHLPEAAMVQPTGLAGLVRALLVPEAAVERMARLPETAMEQLGWVVQWHVGRLAGLARGEPGFDKAAGLAPEAAAESTVVVLEAECLAVRFLVEGERECLLGDAVVERPVARVEDVEWLRRVEEGVS